MTYDQTTKLSLYAEAEISDYWIVNLSDRQLERYSQPYRTAQGDFHYLSKQISLTHPAIVLPGFADAQLDLSRTFPVS